jgi:hypothetical protein
MGATWLWMVRGVKTKSKCIDNAPVKSKADQNFAMCWESLEYKSVKTKKHTE